MGSLVMKCSELLPGWGRDSAAADDLPNRPGKIVVIGRNYSDRDDVAAPSAAPLAVFFKPPTTLIKPGEAVRLPSGIGAVRFEGDSRSSSDDAARTSRPPRTRTWCPATHVPTT